MLVIGPTALFRNLRLLLHKYVWCELFSADLYLFGWSRDQIARTTCTPVYTWAPVCTWAPVYTWAPCHVFMSRDTMSLSLPAAGEINGWLNRKLLLLVECNWEIVYCYRLYTVHTWLYSVYSWDIAWTRMPQMLLFRIAFFLLPLTF